MGKRRAREKIRELEIIGGVSNEKRSGYIQWMREATNGKKTNDGQEMV